MVTSRQMTQEILPHPATLRNFFSLLSLFDI